MDVKVAAAVAGAIEPGRVAGFCRQCGISRQTFYKWRKRYAAEGLDGLSERSRRPLRSPTQIAAEVEEAIVAARKRLTEDGLNPGSWTIVSELLDAGIVAPHESTIYRVLRSRGLIQANENKRPRSSMHRFVWPRPNDMWQIDATHFGLADGTVVEIINIIDDHSRVLTAAVAVPSCTSSQAWSTITTAFATWGVPARVLSDNGLAFSGAHRGLTVPFERNLHHLGVHTITSRPYHPQTCGKVERFHHTQATWLAARPDPITTIAELQTCLDTFTDYYNHHRPHRALNRRTPATIWHATSPAVPQHLPTTTTLSITHLLVDHNGTTRGHRYHFGVGRAHTGHTITIIHDNHNAVLFHHDQLIGTITINPNHRYQRLDHHQPQ